MKSPPGEGRRPSGCSDIRGEIKRGIRATARRHGRNLQDRRA
jgi:hypothetical protein